MASPRSRLRRERDTSDDDSTQRPRVTGNDCDQADEQRVFRYAQAWLGWLSSVVYAGLIVGGLHTVNWWPNGRTAPLFGFVTHDFGLYLVAVVCIWLVMSGVTEAWALLVAKPR
jgi:hypothetical protein